MVVMAVKNIMKLQKENKYLEIVQIFWHKIVSEFKHLGLCPDQVRLYTVKTMHSSTTHKTAVYNPNICFFPLHDCLL